MTRSTFLGLAFKLDLDAEKSWRRICGAERIAELIKGVVFKDGEAMKEEVKKQQRLAARSVMTYGFPKPDLTITGGGVAKFMKHSGYR